MRGAVAFLFSASLCILPAGAQEGPNRCLSPTFVELGRGFAAQNPVTAPIRHASECRPSYSDCTFKILQNRKAAKAEAAIKRGAAFLKQCLPPKHDPAPGAFVVWSYSHFSSNTGQAYLCSVGGITDMQTFNPNNPDQVEWSFMVSC